MQLLTRNEKISAKKVFLLENFASVNHSFFVVGAEN